MGRLEIKDEATAIAAAMAYIAAAEAVLRAFRDRGDAGEPVYTTLIAPIDEAGALLDRARQKVRRIGAALERARARARARRDGTG